MVSLDQKELNDQGPVHRGLQNLFYQRQVF